MNWFGAFDWRQKPSTTDYQKQDHEKQDTSEGGLDEQSSSADDCLQEEYRRRTQHSQFHQDPPVDNRSRSSSTDDSNFKGAERKQRTFGGVLNQPPPLSEKKDFSSDWRQKSSKTDYQKQDHGKRDTSVGGLDEQYSSADDRLQEENRRRIQHSLFLQDPPVDNRSQRSSSTDDSYFKGAERKQHTFDWRQKSLKTDYQSRDHEKRDTSGSPVSQAKTTLKESEKIQNQGVTKELKTQSSEKLLKEWEERLNELQIKNVEQKEYLDDQVHAVQEKIKELQREKEQLNMEKEQFKSKERQLNSQVKEIKAWHDNLKKRKEQLDQTEEQLGRKEKQIQIQEEKINQRTKNLNSREEQVEKKEDHIKVQEEKISEKNTNLNSREGQLERKEKQIKIQEEKINQKNTNLNSREEQLEIKEKQIKIQEEKINQRTTNLNSKEEQLNKLNDDLCNEKKNIEIRQQDLTKKEKRREIQQEQLQKQENEILMKMEMIKMKQETEEEKNKNEKIVKDQSLQIERNLAELQKLKEQLETLTNEIHHMKKEKQSEKRQIITENQQIEKKREVLKRQWTEIETEKEKIQKQEVINKDLIDKQDLDKLRNEEEIKAQVALLHELKINECEETQENACLNLTEGQKEIQMEQKSSTKDELDDATQDSTDTTGCTLQTHKDVADKKPEDDLHRKENRNLISRLNLSNFFPNKLITADTLNISSSFLKEPQSETKRLKEDDLASVFLHKLLMLDYRARSVSVTKVNDTTETKDSDAFETVDTTVTEESDCFDVFLNDGKESKKSNEDENSQIHSVDIQMAVFHCADSFLRQNMVTKLSTCQYALPLLVPSPTSTEIEFPLWTFREIEKTWKSVGDSSLSLPVCQVNAPMVFFCRLGSVSTSKSQLLNSLINPKHDTFFHRNSPGSSKSRVFMDGMVEIAWYCPAGNADDHFRECTAFCNLHGDAVEHRKQTDFLTEQATVTIVLVQNMKLNDEAKEFLKKLFSDSSKHLICLINDLQKSPLTVLSANNIKIGLKDRNQAELHNELIEAVRMCLQKCKSSPTFNLEETSELAKHCGFRVDEDSEDCQEGKNAALEVVKLLKEEDISQIKAKFLPCHGKLWHEWSRKNKQLYRLYGKVEQTKSKIQQEMHSIRDQQREQSLDLIKAVHENVNSMSITKKMYFVKWLGVYLDGSFSDQLSEVTQKYYKQLSEVYLLKQKGKMTEEKQEELERLSEKVDAMTLGLEHIVREMGQLYEAWSAKPEEMDSDVSALPALAADLLISGHPLELMDGDAAHVPLIWIESVLDKVIEKLGDQRVFVLSVLGLQSSGKSTLLNTMFGLQFAVSAGRCTRGAFMQLIRVKEEAKEELKFDYLLVVDTEGLQSLQLVSKQSALTHDNELATFVTGLADLTLINIFGENPAEMQDIIQIVVQAFLRMKEVNLTPGCMFVHQNATDISAGEKNMEGRRRLQEKLDEITRLAAAEEGCRAQYFTEVIKINIQTDLHYIAQLWEDNPPMAPPNPRYSENVQKLKQAILRSAAQKKCLRISEFKVRIEDLWTAVLNEDFVFSFKNTLEISAEKRLEAMYGNWTWTIRENMLFIQNKLQNQIENGNLLFVDQKQICEDLSVTFSTVKTQMETFFTEDKDAEILYQWKEKSEQRITDVHDKLIKDTARKMTQLMNLKATCESLNNTKTQLENELFNRSKEFTSTRQGKPMDEEGIRNEFQSMWEKWLSTIKIPPMENCDIKEKVGEILRSYFESQTFYSRLQSKNYKHICTKGDYSEYVTMMKDVFHLTCYNLNTEDHTSVQQLVQEIVREAEEIIRNKPVVRTGYSDAYTQEILNCVKKQVGGFKAKKFQLNNEFTVDLTLYVCEIAVREFTVCQKTFREANDPLIYLEKKKEEFFSIFKKQCEGATATTVFAEFVCSKLKPSILQAVYDQAAIDAAREMKSDFPAFRGNRSNLEKHILQDLAEAKTFERFISYIKNPKKCFSDFIEVGIKNHMFKGENPRILHILKNAVKMKKSSVATTIQVAQNTMQNKNVKQWLERFSLEIKDEMKFSVNDLEGAQFQDITDTEFFVEVLDKALQSVFNSIYTSFDHISSVRMDMFRQKPEDILVEQLCGCWVQCPGCEAVCTNTIQGHDGDHSVPFHRPNGISGWNWQGTDNLLVDICTSLVVSDACICLEDGRSFPWRKYRKAGPKYACWSISPNSSEQPYWKWFVCQFQTDLEQHYKKCFQGWGEIPLDWRSITKKKALESLNV